MDKDTAKQLLKFVNSPFVEEDLAIYADSRIEYLRGCLDYASSVDEIRKLQGAIEEMKRLKKIKDEVRQKADDEWKKQQ